MSLPSLRLSFTDPATGDYYKAVENVDQTWTVTSGVSPYYIKHLPKDWNKTQITWQRNPKYMGIFRSESSDYAFAKDARAILNYVLSTQGVQGSIILTTEILIETESSPGAMDFWRYEACYQSEITFKGAFDDKQHQLFTCKTLDSQLVELLYAWGDQAFNIPYWTWDAGTSQWLVNESEVGVHEGIKLLYSADFVSAATSAAPIRPQFTSNKLYGYNHASNSDGRHWLPAFEHVDVTQPNGATTFVGNDFLSQHLLLGNQSAHYDLTWNAESDSRPFSRNEYLVKNLLNATVDVIVSISGSFSGALVYRNFTIYSNQIIGFRLVEIGADDQRITEISIHSVPLPTNGSPYTAGAFSGFSTATLNPLSCYVLMVVYDDIVTGISGIECQINIADLNIKIASTYNSGTGTAVNAPSFPPSPYMAFRPYKLLQKLVPCLNSVVSDPYGFPLIPPGTTYAGISAFLSDSAGTEYDDNIPYDTFLTSGNALSIITGQPYISMSVNGFYDICRKIWSCGLGIEVDNIRIEPLSYFFDSATEVFALGANVRNLVIEPTTDLMASVLKGGYNPQDVNSDFGVEMVHQSVEYTTPLTKFRTSTDMQISGVVADQYVIENARRRQTDKETQNQSSGNDSYLIEIDRTVTYSLPATVNGEAVGVYTPDGGPGAPSVPYTVTGYGVKRHLTAQSTDPTAATAPYIAGYNYPETAINISLTPQRNLYRNSKLLYSIYDNRFFDFLAFRKQYQMQFNNTALALPGIKSKLSFTRKTYTETEDIPITNFSGGQLFRPYFFKFESTGAVNMYAIIRSNPRGYISFLWKGVLFKGFIWKVTQRLGDKAATPFELIAHPATTDDQIRTA